MTEKLVLNCRNELSINKIIDLLLNYRLEEIMI